MPLKPKPELGKLRSIVRSRWRETWQAVETRANVAELAPPLRVTIQAHRYSLQTPNKTQVLAKS
ncbi:MAG: hypothetical protein F6K36_00940 [Symploca sp. SIO3C6]|uniref:Uncharacterized protein n=1 Tax=Symploca sp. SIO1C4 TaxID=2607765 RepID=A0A6B3N6J7_9CYAN|nr:hypothetical protein [Symploca sp. SIO3C6]NER27207.1 hypothetical protein [Symploca sp. SIO1C4]NET06160.1 hypothetical protein [Symploca sp. SIO2B6]NET52839.1 hypothetical protein [Merismopedia sp. SIO2A8]